MTLSDMQLVNVFVKSYLIGLKICNSRTSENEIFSAIMTLKYTPIYMHPYIPIFFYLFDYCCMLCSFFHALLLSCLFLLAPKASVRAGIVIDKLPPSSWRGECDCL